MLARASNASFLDPSLRSTFVSSRTSYEPPHLDRSLASHKSFRFTVEFAETYLYSIQSDAAIYRLLDQRYQAGTVGTSSSQPTSTTLTTSNSSLRGVIAGPACERWSLESLDTILHQ